MFDVGFSELMVIGLVALVVIGPEDLPRVARTVGHLLGKLRRYVADVKSDISREMELSDLKRLQEEVKESAAELHNAVNEQARALQEEFHSAAEPVVAQVHELGASALANPAVEAPAIETPAIETPTIASSNPAVIQPSTPVFESPVLPLEPAPAVVPATHSHHTPEPDPDQLDLFGAVQEPIVGKKG